VPYNGTMNMSYEELRRSSTGGGWRETYIRGDQSLPLLNSYVLNRSARGSATSASRRSGIRIVMVSCRRSIEM